MFERLDGDMMWIECMSCKHHPDVKHKNSLDAAAEWNKREELS